jgi:RHS repeat-associated protein
MATTTYTTFQGEILSETQSGERRDYVPDPQGSIRILFGANQLIRGAAAYWPFGESLSVTGTGLDRWTYGGALGYRRDNSHRFYVVARHYRSDLSRWFTPDVLWPLLPPYGYASSSPTTNVDPSGRAPIFGMPPHRPVRCTPAWNQYVYEFCVRCYSSSTPECLQECSILADAYYRACNKPPRRPPLPGHHPDVWHPVPGKGIVPKPSLRPLPCVPEIAPPDWERPTIGPFNPCDNLEFYCMQQGTFPFGGAGYGYDVVKAIRCCNDAGCPESVRRSCIAHQRWAWWLYLYFGLGQF